MDKSEIGRRIKTVKVVIIEGNRSIRRKHDVLRHRIEVEVRGRQGRE